MVTEFCNQRMQETIFVKIPYSGFTFIRVSVSTYKRRIKLLSPFSVFIQNRNTQTLLVLADTLGKHQ